LKWLVLLTGWVDSTRIFKEENNANTGNYDNAMLDCKNSGYDGANHFPDVRKTLKCQNQRKNKLSLILTKCFGR
jgi:hypothetical protein